MATWTSYTVRPFPIGGAGRVRAKLVNPADRVIALVGTSQASAWDAAGFVVADLSFSAGSGAWTGSFFGAIRADAVVSFFVFAEGVWTAGPVISGVPLVYGYGSEFPWIKKWVVDRLQELSNEGQPLGVDTRLKVSGAFARDIAAFPMIAVQVDSIAPSGDAVGRILDGVQVRGINYNLNLSIVAWCLTPEDRDDVAVWLGGALEGVMDLIVEVGCLEPSISLDEAEDFETLGVPVFLCTARLNTSAWSCLTKPKPHEYGLLTTL